MVKSNKTSLTKLLDTHTHIYIYTHIAPCSDVIYDPEVLPHSHVTDALLGISAVLCYRYPSIGTGCRYLLMAYER